MAAILVKKSSGTSQSWWSVLPEIPLKRFVVPCELASSDVLEVVVASQAAEEFQKIDANGGGQVLFVEFCACAVRIGRRLAGPSRMEARGYFATQK